MKYWWDDKDETDHYNVQEWETMSIFLTFLIPELPDPQDDDLFHSILEAIDMDNYRVENLAPQRIILKNENGTIDPFSTTGGGGKPEPELDLLSNILKQFNDLFGNVALSDADKTRQLITVDIPEQLRKNTAYQNAIPHSDRQNARIEHNKVLQEILLAYLKDLTQLYGQYSDNLSFQKWLQETMFGVTYSPKTKSDGDIGAN